MQISNDNTNISHVGVPISRLVLYNSTSFSNLTISKPAFKQNNLTNKQVYVCLAATEHVDKKKYAHSNALESSKRFRFYLLFVFSLSVGGVPI